MVRIHFEPETALNGRMRLCLNQEYVKGFDPDRIAPEPESVEVADRFVYTFELPATNQPTETFDSRISMPGLCV